MSGAAWLGRLAPVALLGALGCGASGGEGAAPRPPSEIVAAALRGEDGECSRPADCASGVCSSGSCASVADGGQLWKAYAIAKTLRPLLEGEEGLAAARPLLAALVRDDKAHVREHVAVFLGGLGLPALAPLLEPLVADLDPAVQLQAELAQLRLGLPASRARLLSHPSVAVRLAAVDALGAWLASGPADAKAVADVLAERALATGEDHRVVQRALVALLALKSPEPELMAELGELGQDHAEGFLAHDVARLLAEWRAKP